MLYQHLFRQCPDYIPLVEEMAMLAGALKQEQAAEKLLRHLLTLDPGEPGYWHLLAEVPSLDENTRSTAKQRAQCSARQLLPLRIDRCQHFLNIHRQHSAEALLERITALAPQAPQTQQLTAQIKTQKH